MPQRFCLPFWSLALILPRQRPRPVLATPGHARWVFARVFVEAPFRCHGRRLSDPVWVVSLWRIRKAHGKRNRGDAIPEAILMALSTLCQLPTTSAIAVQMFSSTKVYGARRDVISVPSVPLVRVPSFSSSASI